MTNKVGKAVPTGFTFRYIDTSNPDDPSCKFPVPLTLSKQFFAGKTVVFVAVPAAFSPTCLEVHIPEILTRLEEFKSKKVDLLIVLSNNDAFVLDAWRKELVRHTGIDLGPFTFLRKNTTKTQVLFASDSNAEFSKALGLVQDSLKMGMGLRTARYAIIVRDGVVKYCEKENKPGVSVSGALALLSKL